VLAVHVCGDQDLSLGGGGGGSVRGGRDVAWLDALGSEGVGVGAVARYRLPGSVLGASRAWLDAPMHA
jgi:hypothetical protein